MILIIKLILLLGIISCTHKNPGQEPMKPLEFSKNKRSYPGIVLSKRERRKLEKKVERIKRNIHKIRQDREERQNLWIRSLTQQEFEVENR